MANIEIKLDKKAKVIVSETADIGGVEPTGTIDITENGEYDVKTVATANVNVPSEQVPVYEGPYTIQQPGTIEIKDKKATQNILVDINAVVPLNYYYVSSGAVTTFINQQIMPSSCYLYNGQNSAYEPLSRIAIVDHWNKKGGDPTLTNLISGQTYKYDTDGPVAGFEDYLMPIDPVEYPTNSIVLMSSSGGETAILDGIDEDTGLGYSYYVYQEPHYDSSTGDEFLEPNYQQLYPMQLYFQRDTKGILQEISSDQIQASNVYMVEINSSADYAMLRGVTPYYSQPAEVLNAFVPELNYPGDSNIIYLSYSSGLTWTQNINDFTKATLILNDNCQNHQASAINMRYDVPFVISESSGYASIMEISLPENTGQSTTLEINGETYTITKN